MSDHYRSRETFGAGFVLVAIVVFLVGLGFVLGLTAAFALRVLG